MTPEGIVQAAQTAIVLMGNAHQHMAQERRKKILMNVNSALKTMAEEEKGFQKAAPMLFGDEFAKLATERVEAVKPIKKLAKPPQEQQRKLFSGYHPRNQQPYGRGGGYRNGRGNGKFNPYPRYQQSRQGTSGQGSQTQKN